MKMTSSLGHALLRVTELRALEQAAQATLAPSTLMARAGAAAADWIGTLGSDILGPIWILTGPGNNGGDALVVARLLAERGIAVRVALFEVAEKFSGDALWAWQSLQASRAPWSCQSDLTGIDGAAMIVDGLFGIGLSRALPAKACAWIATVNDRAARGVPVVALDVPSGLAADSGAIIGTACITASHTLTFLADKPGLHTLSGPDHAGQVSLASLGLEVPLQTGFLNAPAHFKPCLVPRSRNSHKGSFGNLGVIGGNQGMVGAVLLAARMGLYGGAGRVYVQALADHAPVFDITHPELMLRVDFTGLALDAVVLGPGMGDDARAAQELARYLAGPNALVLDADALNKIAAQPALATRLSERGAGCVMTPHPLEAARLLHTDVHTVQADRIAAALELARQFNAVVVLKGVGSVIANADGRWAINPTGNPALASAGTGDVLAGLIGALLAQHWDAWQAALGGVYIHGRAADVLVADDVGPIGLSAHELIPAVRKVLNNLIATASGPPNVRAQP